MNKRVKELEDLIVLHKELYYQGKATISDEAYDRLEEELKTLCPESPILIMVGALQKSDNKIKHEKKMLSLEKTYENEKLKSWIGDEEIIATFKYDGSACSLVYKEGTLYNAKTRGDGVWGEGILEKVFFIKDIPRKIQVQEIYEVRGEIYCTEDNFIELSKHMEKIGLEKPMSLRNIVAGILGRKDHHELAQHLSFTSFELMTEKKFLKEEDKILNLQKNHFPIPDYVVCKKWEQVENVIKKCQKFFNEGDFLIDGLVITYNKCALAEELGQTSHHPKHKIAFKFQGESKHTIIENIEWSISRNGRCTPVAIVKPIDISGAIVSRVTLHHYGLVETFQLKAGDEIEVVRSGEVIPKFLRVIKSSKHKFNVIENCPSCNKKLSIDEHWLKCNNEQCPQKKEQELLYFIKTMGIEEISEMRLREMIKRKLIQEIPDLYTLEVEDFLTLEKVKDKLAHKFYQQIQKSKKVELVKLIEAMGIEGLGETKVQKIIDHGYDTIEKIFSLTCEDLEKIDGFAHKSAMAITEGLKTKSGLLYQLIKVGIVINNNAGFKESEKLKGLKICITGALSRPRDQIIAEIKKHSGIVQESVNKETSYLVTNEVNSTSSKYVKAQKLGVRIISEKKLEELLYH